MQCIHFTLAITVVVDAVHSCNPVVVVAVHTALYMSGFWSAARILAIMASD